MGAENWLYTKRGGRAGAEKREGGGGGGGGGEWCGGGEEALLRGRGGDLGVRSGVRMGRQLFAQLVRDDALGLAAELAYRFFLAIFPFFIFLASVGAFFPTVFRLPNPARHFVDLLAQIMPPAAA